MNRYELESMRAGVAKSLEDANLTLSKMYMDATTEREAREKQAKAVEDLEERLAGILKQIKTIDQENANKIKLDHSDDPKKAMTTAKAELYRATIKRAPMDAEKTAILDTAESGGNLLLPKTVSDDIITGPTVTNPLRGLSTVTNITNLEIPKLSFTLDDEGFVKDGETAKEMKAATGTVAFTRNKFKVKVPVSETVLSGSDANLVAIVEQSLLSGLAKKEKKVAFDVAPTGEYKHMSFYAKTGDDYDIKAVGGATLYKSIKSAIADLEEDYRDRATVVMRYADYLEIVEELANGSATLYNAPPEQIIGKPVKFCDLAVVPVVGDYSYSHYNYDMDMTVEHDKDIETGITQFVLTSWFDHRIKMLSAFRLATVTIAPSI